MSKSVFMSTLFVLCSLAGLAIAGEKKEEVPVVYGIIRADCEEKFRNLDPMSDTSCVVFSIMKLVGFAIVGGSAILKLPQIINILKAGSCEGIPASSYYFETMVFLNTLGNARHQGLAFSDYGENAIIIV